MIVLLPLLVCIIGLVVYAIATNPKAQELGRLMFFAGLFVALFELAPRVVSFFR